MDRNETPGKETRPHKRLHSRNPFHHGSTRPSLFPVKRKLPSIDRASAPAPTPEKNARPLPNGPAPFQAPTAASSRQQKVASAAAAAKASWDSPLELPTALLSPSGVPPGGASLPTEKSRHTSPAEPPPALEILLSEDAPPAGEMAQEPQAAPAFRKQQRLQIFLSALIPVFAGALAISLWQIFSIQKEYGEAASEYDQLRRQVFAAPSAPAAESGLAEAEKEEAVFDLQSVKSMNPECVAWIEIPGTSLSYPLVRAEDNEKYLNHTFLGNQNSAGAIFLDYRNAANLQDQHLILYGHNMKNGSMFGLLPHYLDESYRQAHPTLVLQDGSQVYTYQIFSARITDAYDPSYRIDFASQEEFSAFAESHGAPSDTAQMLTLSTCTNVNDDERILVHAHLVSTSPT